MSKIALRSIFLIIVIAMALPAGATPPQADSPLTRQFDEFGDIQASDLIARLDNLAIHLHEDPLAMTFLIVYRTRRDLPGLSNRYAHRMRSYLVNSRGISPDRIITVDGGIAGCLSQEIWIMPAGGAAPKPRADAYLESYRPAAYMFDEHHYVLGDDVDGNIYWSTAPADLQSYLEAFAEELRKHPKSTGYLVAYRSFNRDRASAAQTMLRRERNFLIKELGIKPSQIKTVVGGQREWRTMELWIARDREGARIIPSNNFIQRRKRY